MAAPAPDYSYTDDAPTAIAVGGALTDAGAGAIDATVALTETGATAATVPDFSPAGGGAGAVTVPDGAPDGTPPVAIDLGSFAATSANAIGRGLTTSPLAAMPASFPSAFSSEATLRALTVGPNDLNRLVQGTINGEFKTFQVRAGAQAESEGIYHPANYNAMTNAYVFVQC